MFTTKQIFESAIEKATKSAYKKFGVEPFEQGEKGLVSVRVVSKRKSLRDELRALGAISDGVNGLKFGLHTLAPSNIARKRSLGVKEEFADTFKKVLEDNGFECYVDSKIL